MNLINRLNPGHLLRAPTQDPTLARTQPVYRPLYRRQNAGCATYMMPANATACSPQAISCDIPCLTRTVLDNTCRLPVPALCADVWECPETTDDGAPTAGSKAAACFASLNRAIDCCTGKQSAQTAMVSLVAAATLTDGAIAAVETEAPLAAPSVAADGTLQIDVAPEDAGADASLVADVIQNTIIAPETFFTVPAFTPVTDVYTTVTYSDGPGGAIVTDPGGITSTTPSVSPGGPTTPNTPTQPVVSPKNPTQPQISPGAATPNPTLTSTRSTTTSTTTSPRAQTLSPMTLTTQKVATVVGKDGSASTSTMISVVTQTGTAAGTTDTVGVLASSGAQCGARFGGSGGSAKKRLAFGMIALLLAAANG